MNEQWKLWKARWTGTGKRVIFCLAAIVCLVLDGVLAYAAVPQEDTPEYKVAFYASSCYHMQDENGKRYGYGYDMMQEISNYLQSTFSYVGYEKTPAECEEMLRRGEIDIYTAAKRTPERQQEFAFSTHPAITARTCMNIKRGNHDVVAGDYTTYEGLRIGLLERHTYNNRFIEFTKEKGFHCDIVYYATPTELSNALVDGEVDALVNSYIRTPEDEKTVEDFGETPYYFMVKKENKFLVDQIDAAIDEMNIETPNWRSDLYNQYYGSQDRNTELTAKEEALLRQLQADHTKIRAVMNPDRNPYSWYQDGRGYGIVADIFTTTAKQLGLEYEIIPVSSQEEYQNVLTSGEADIWMDLDGYYEDEGSYKYKVTKPYLSTTVSVLHRRGSSGKISRLGVLDNTIAVKEITASVWPTAKIIPLDTPEQCVEEIINEKIDGALLMSYSAQKVARDDTQNRLSVDVVPGSVLNLRMGVNSKNSRYFYGLWEKTLTKVAEKNGAEFVQSHLETVNTPTLVAYLFDHPGYLFGMIGFGCVTVLIVGLYVESTQAKNKQLRISTQLAQALREAREANDAKLNFFSKMSHDIRTPLNVVLGMTQIAKKYKNNPDKLDHALDSITSEGNYLLTMINSILDVNQLEHGHIELIYKPFNPSECMKNSMRILQPLAAKKKQQLILSADFEDHIVVGDSGRFSQIMINIVSNAIKYTEAGGRIEVSLEALSTNRYRFTCTDNGIGMSEEYIKHICEDYSRAEDSRTASTEGTGLGMAVVKGFTDLMHGTLSIQSKLGEGSTFVVELPFAEPSIKEQKQMKQALNAKEQSSLDLRGKKVLLAEDNALNAEIAMELLSSMGLSVDWAENGQDAVDKFKQSKPYTYFAVFMDMQMPVMDGVEATKQIRSCEREDRDVIILAMTANTLTKDRQLCEEVGMNGYISKPVNLKEIEDTLRENQEIV